MSNLEDIICEAIQDDCIGHCNHPYCYKVNKIVDKLKEHNVHFDVPADKVYATRESCEQSVGGKTMNRVKVFNIEYPKDIESTVNEYCRKYMLNPICVNVCVEPSFRPSFIVSVVVEPVEGAS